MSEPVNQINHAEPVKSPATVLFEAIFICGDCPECGSDNWTDCGEHGECHSCGAKFNPTIPRQMAKASRALAAMQKELEAEIEEGERLNRAMNEQQSTITAQAERIARLEEALGVAKEAMDERRGYVNGGNPSACWQEMKYGEIWDQEDAQVAAALAPPTP